MDYQDDVVELRILVSRRCQRRPLGGLGIAGRMDFSYDEVEDIKLAMGRRVGAMKDVAPEFAASP